MSSIKEFHLFAGIGGGIYGGSLLNHECCGGVEINEYCQRVLKQRQKDGWMNEFDVYGDLTKLSGCEFKGTFDVLCGGFPCQAFSTAAHGNNLAYKNLWGEMRRFVIESDAPVVFAENVTLNAILTAKNDLENDGYIVEYCKLSCSELGADHKRNRFWLLAIKEFDTLARLIQHHGTLNKIHGGVWSKPPNEYDSSLTKSDNLKARLSGSGNAQSPIACAVAFRVLLNRHARGYDAYPISVSGTELREVFVASNSWIKKNNFGKCLVHTPTVTANYSAPSMMKHECCRNFRRIFNEPTPENAEYLMGLPIGATSCHAQDKTALIEWRALSTNNNNQ